MQDLHKEFLRRRMKAALLDALLVGAIPGIVMLIFGSLALVPFITGQAFGTPDPRTEFPILFLVFLAIFFLDAMIVAVGPALIFYAVLGGGGMFGGGILLLLGLVSTIVNWFCHALCESSAAQATIGMGKFGLKLQTLKNTRVSFARASLRHFAKIISVAAIFLGFAQALWNPGGRTLHDALSGTVVADTANAEFQSKVFNRMSKSEWLFAVFGVCVLAFALVLPISYVWPYWTIQQLESRAKDAVYRGNFEKAELLFLKALRQAEQFGHNSNDVAGVLDSLARFYADRHKYSQAEEAYKRLIPFCKKDSPAMLATELELFAECYYRQGHFREAAPLYQRALGLQIRIASGRLFAKHPAGHSHDTRLAIRMIRPAVRIMRPPDMLA